MKGLVVPEPSEDFTADPVELFFDLAFVFAFSQLVSHLVHHPTWTGAWEAGLLFLILWLAWSTFTWAANAVQGNARAVRAIFLAATAISIPMGAAVTKAYSSGGGTFAVCASLIVVLGIWLIFGPTALIGITFPFIADYDDKALGPGDVLGLLFGLAVVMISVTLIVKSTRNYLARKTSMPCREDETPVEC